jgi:hypothetical protein
MTKIDLIGSIKPFLIGGTVIAGSHIVSQFAPAKFAPLIGGMPTGIIASYFFATQQKKHEYFAGYAVSAVVLAIAIVGLQYTLTILPKTNVDIISAVFLIIWAIISFFAVKFFVHT